MLRLHSAGALAVVFHLVTVCVASGLSGSLQKITFAGPVTSNSVTFSLYLPPGYSAATNHYPLVIHLHGIGGTHDGQQTNLVSASHEAVVKKSFRCTE